MTEGVIQEQITLYTQQLDSFDQFSTNYVMTVIGFVGVIAAAIMAMLGARKKISIYFANLADGSFKLKGKESFVADDGSEKERTVCYWNKWGKFQKYYFTIYCILVVVSTVFITACLIDLVSNGYAMDTLHSALRDAAGI